MSDHFPTNEFPTNDMNDPTDPTDPHRVSRAMPTPTTPAGFTAGPPPYSDGQPTTPLPTGYPASPYGAPTLAGGAGGPQGPGGAGRLPRGRDWRRWGLIGAIILVGLLVLGGGAVLAGVALAHGTATPAHTTTPATTTATPSPSHQAPVYTVTSVSAGAIDATTASGAPVTITISAQTVYVRADQPASLSDITSGTKIRVLGRQKADGSITARRITIVVPATHGKVTAINGNAITIQTAKGTVTITINTTTKFGKGQTLSVIHVGDVVEVAGVRNSDGSYTALAILDRTAAMNASGAPTSTTPTPAA